jgi:P-type Ca2+ transporter type 2C
LIGYSLLQGLIVLLMVLAVFLVTLSRWQDESEARALTFATLIVANLALIFSNRSADLGIATMLRAPNRALWWVVGGALALVAIVFYVPPIRALFRMATLHGSDVAVCVAAGVVSVAWFDLAKLLGRWRRATAPARTG